MQHRFPILASPHGMPKSIPWDLVEPHRHQAELNHHQSLEQLANRGGLSWPELVAVISDQRYHDLFPKSAYQKN